MCERGNIYEEVQELFKKIIEESVRSRRDGVHPTARRCGGLGDAV